MTKNEFAEEFFDLFTKHVTMLGMVMTITELTNKLWETYDIKKKEPQCPEEKKQ